MLSFPEIYFVGILTHECLGSAGSGRTSQKALQHKEVDVVLSPLEDDKAQILFREPQLAVTPGQSAVFYLDDIVMGGGIIEQAL